MFYHIQRQEFFVYIYFNIPHGCVMLTAHRDGSPYPPEYGQNRQGESRAARDRASGWAVMRVKNWAWHRHTTSPTPFRQSP